MYVVHGNVQILASELEGKTLNEAFERFPKIHKVVLKILHKKVNGKPVTRKRKK